MYNIYIYLELTVVLVGWGGQRGGQAGLHTIVGGGQGGGGQGGGGQDGGQDGGGQDGGEQHGEQQER